MPIAVATAILAIVHLTTATVPTPSEPFDHSVSLENNGSYHMFWKFDEKTITFEVHVKTRGYVGFGISPNGGMKGADIVIGWVKDGQVYFKDRFGEDHDKMPTVDPEQNWELLSGTEKDSHTILKFRRNLQTCDTRDLAIGESTARVIWSYHPADPDSEDKIPYHEHGRRGSKSIYLIQTFAPPASIIPSDTRTFDFLNPNVRLTSKHTTYWCQGFKAPKIAKHHIIKMEPVIQKGRESLVHHIALYGCTVPMNDSHHGVGFDCLVPNMDVGFHRCQSMVIYVWTVGGNGLSTPPHAGIVMGGEDGPTFFVMETHYDNPQERADWVDNSGIRLTVTPTLRDHDASVLMIGAPFFGPQPVIPPYYDGLRTRHICSNVCLQQYVPDEGIKLFASSLHSHLLAHEIRMHHFRNGKQLPSDLGTDKNYDFNYQEYRPLKHEITVLKNDTLVVDCVYRSSGKTKLTWGGASTKDEMCLGSLLYYPAIPLSYCLSDVLEEELLAIAGHIKLNKNKVVTSPAEYANRTWMDILENEVDWKQATVREDFQNLYLKSRQLPTCLRPGHSTTKVYRKEPAVEVKLKDTSTDCPSAASDDHSPAGLLFFLAMCAYQVMF